MNVWQFLLNTSLLFYFVLFCLVLIFRNGKPFSRQVTESGIHEIFAVGIRNPVDWDPKSTFIWNPEPSCELILKPFAKKMTVKDGMECKDYKRRD